MSDKKSDKEKTVKKTSKKKEKKTAKGPRIIWLYGAHPSIVKRTLWKLANYGSNDCISLRRSLGLSLDHTVISIHAYPIKGRDRTIKQFSEVNTDAVFVVMGMPADKKNKKTHKLYEDAEVALVHPGEHDFHITMMRETDSMTYNRAKELKEEWEEFLNDHFDKKDIHII